MKETVVIIFGCTRYLSYTHLRFICLRALSYQSEMETVENDCKDCLQKEPQELPLCSNKWNIICSALHQQGLQVFSSAAESLFLRMRMTRRCFVDAAAPRAAATAEPTSGAKPEAAVYVFQLCPSCQRGRCRGRHCGRVLRHPDEAPLVLHIYIGSHIYIYIYI